MNKNKHTHSLMYVKLLGQRLHNCVIGTHVHRNTPLEQNKREAQSFHAKTKNTIH
jgi:hypothetical protein